MIESVPDLNKIKSDPVLRTFHINKWDFICYDISGFFSPISIRDQIIRAASVIDRAISHRLISSSRPLLVVGAGPAGITAALRAAENDIPTVLIDSGEVLQRLLASERYFSPVQYDWSSVHWRETKFPWEDSRLIPVTLYEDSVNAAMEALSVQFHTRWSQKPDVLFLRQYMTISRTIPVDRPNDIPLIKVDYHPRITEAALPPISEFGMGLSSTGFGGERTTLNNSNFAGVKYWNLEVFDAAEKGSLLICGGGDGALQDFLLFSTTCVTAKEIYESLSLDDAVKRRLENKIRSAENRSKKPEIWLNKGINDPETNAYLCSIYRSLHETHRQVVHELLDDVPSVRDKLAEIVKGIAPANINLAYGCDHFSGCYPLNRFLAILVGEYLKEVSGREIFIEKSRVTGISGIDGHHCNNNVDECDRGRHQVELVEGITCTEEAVSATSVENYDTVILRFGINEQEVPLIFEEKPAFPGSQILPPTLL